MTQIDAAMKKNIKEILKQTSAKIIPSGSPEVKQNASNPQIRATQSCSPKQKDHVPAFKAFNKPSAPQEDNQAKLPEAKIWSSTRILSYQDKHFHSPIKSNDSGIYFDVNNSIEVNTTINATDNLSKTFGQYRKTSWKNIILVLIQSKNLRL